jgi:hypothetical protein
MRTLFLLCLMAVCASPIAAQDFELPDGWNLRFDRPGQSEADLEAFVEMPPGWHVTSGPAAIYWGPDMEASGNFRAEMEVFLFDPGERREAFGMFVGGKNMDGDAIEYTYFLLRNGGQYIIKRREGVDAPTVRPWTSHEAIKSYADRGEDASVKNTLVIEANGDAVSFSVNGAEVASVSRSEAGMDGVFGFRVNHALNLHISKVEVTPIG